MSVKVYGMPASANAMAPTLFAMHAGVGGLEMCNLMEGAHMTPEFLAMNPFHHIPTMKDGELAVGEGSAILRYIALKYKQTDAYPEQDLEKTAMIDFALTTAQTEVYQAGFYPVVYPVMGFAPNYPEDQAAANKAFNEAIDTWLNHFVKNTKFVVGDKPTIADFMMGTYLFAAVQPGIEAKTGFKASDRAKKYVEDFLAAVPSTKMLKEAGGYSIAEYIAAQAAK